ncbi:hypothetical protein [Allobaculum sp. Allo2]|uniref:hypothetical protein n=1 Tax=Allobaculum sp. Allo2 TaxID=2853432 RepID=UPI001F614918|nr:hypothetical protein [Allobaculum sp. Allo2]UNT94035.1 hypothetical protein KWG61_05130 [Allobaculum sp. Allo2]
MHSDGFSRTLKSLNAQRLSQELGSDPYTVSDILSELASPDSTRVTRSMARF